MTQECPGNLGIQSLKGNADLRLLEVSPEDEQHGAAFCHHVCPTVSLLYEQLYCSTDTNLGCKEKAWLQILPTRQVTVQRCISIRNRIMGDLYTPFMLSKFKKNYYAAFLLFRMCLLYTQLI